MTAICLRIQLLLDDKKFKRSMYLVHVISVIFTSKQNRLHLIRIYNPQNGCIINCYLGTATFDMIIKVTSIRPTFMDLGD